MSLKRWLLASHVALFFNLAAMFVDGQGDKLNCDPCINRPTYRIQAIVHGTSDDMFWQRLRASSIQAGKDMRVELDFELYDEYHPELMAEDIEASVTGPNPPDALIVTIPDSSVEEAIVKATKSVPVFGMNSGYDVANNVGVLDFVAMDEREGGRAAGKEFRKENRNITRALFVNHNKGNSAMNQRLVGFTEGLGGDVIVEELVVERQQLVTAESSVLSAVESCKYDAILLGGSASTLEMTLEAMKLQSCPGPIYLGAFDESSDAYAAIATGRLLFIISQQTHLQGTLSVVAAATYATTEKKLSSSQATFGTYLSGPVVVDVSNLPSDTLQICEDESFPVCPDLFEPDVSSTSSCKCQIRKNIKIGGVLHGVTTDIFWDIVFEQARQAADDLGIDLKLERLEPQPSASVWHSKMASRITSLCNEGVHGIFVTIPSDLVHKAIQHCQDLNIPVVSINSGAVDAKELNITHHISQLEYQAGFEAGSRMAEESITSGTCLGHEESNTAIEERCRGFGDGLKSVSSNITYNGLHVVPLDSKLVYVEKVENIIGIEGDWDGIGAVSIGVQTLDALMMVKELHPKLVVATFDTNDKMYEYLEAGTILYGVDQNPFMQGYMPVWLLTIMAHTKQHLRNQYIETGPRLVEKPPSDALKTCDANNFNVCPRPVDENKNQIDKIRPLGLTLAAISMSLSLGLLVWVWFYREATVVRKSQPLFLGMICVGTFLMAATIIPLSVDDSLANEDICTVACIATPWFLWIGFIITFSALYSKIHRINQLLRISENFRRVKITAWDVMPTFCILLTLTLIFLLVWTVVDPMYWIRKEITGSANGLTSFGSCGLGKTYVSKAMLGCLIVLAFACVTLACIAAWYGRKISVEYSESQYVTTIVIAMLQAFPIGIPLIILSYQNPTARYFVSVAITFVLSMTVLLLIFVPKIHFLRQEKAGRGARRSVYGASLRVVGTNQMVPRESAVIATGMTGITKTQVEDLKQNIIEIGTIDENTDFLSMVKSIGIIVSDSGDLRSSAFVQSSRGTFLPNHTFTSTSLALGSTIFEADGESSSKPGSSTNLEELST